MGDISQVAVWGCPMCHATLLEPWQLFPDTRASIEQGLLLIGCEFCEYLHCPICGRVVTDDSNEDLAAIIEYRQEFTLVDTVGDVYTQIKRSESPDMARPVVEWYREGTQGDMVRTEDLSGVDAAFATIMEEW